jgi:hypothetical protein
LEKVGRRALTAVPPRWVGPEKRSVWIGFMYVLSRRTTRDATICVSVYVIS